MNTKWAAIAGFCFLFLGAHALAQVAQTQPAPISPAAPVAVPQAPAPTLGKLAAIDASKVRPGIIYSFDALGGYVGARDLNGAGGSVSSSRVGGRLSLLMPVDKKLDVGLTVGGSDTFYDFSGPSGLIPGNAHPWNNIHSLTLGALASYRLDDHWRVFAGASGNSAGEYGSDFDQSLSAGGEVGAEYTSKQLTVGLAITGHSRLEASPFILPFPLVNWVLPFDPQERWSLQVGATRTGAATDAGVALVFAPSKTIAFSAGLSGLGLGGEFRLNENGPVPDGIGRDTSFPLALGVTWRPRRALRISGFVGLNAFGTVEELDRHGNEIAQRNTGPAPTVGINASFSF